MKKIMKKIIAILLVVGFSITSIPVSAEPIEDMEAPLTVYTEEISSEPEGGELYSYDPNVVTEGEYVEAVESIEGDVQSEVALESMFAEPENIDTTTVPETIPETIETEPPTEAPSTEAPAAEPDTTLPLTEVETPTPETTAAPVEIESPSEETSMSEIEETPSTEAPVTEPDTTLPPTEVEAPVTEPDTTLPPAEVETPVTETTAQATEEESSSEEEYISEIESTEAEYEPIEEYSEEASENTEETTEATKTEFIYEDDEIYAIVTLNEADALPENSQFFIKEVFEDSIEEEDRELFQWSKEQLDGFLQNKLQMYTVNSFYYDMYFEEDGAKVMPANEFKLEITYKKDKILDKDANKENVRITYFNDNETTNEIELIDTEAKLEVNELGSVTKAEFTIAHYQYPPLMIFMWENQEAHDARLAAEAGEIAEVPEEEITEAASTEEELTETEQTETEQEGEGSDDLETKVVFMETEDQQDQDEAAKADEEAVTDSETVTEEEVAAEEKEEEEKEETEEDTTEEETEEESEEAEESEETEPVEAEPTVRLYPIANQASSGNVYATAVLSDAAQVPDDAKLWITPVTPDSSDYNYDAYMNALNEQSAGTTEYTPENTLLYDIAFMVPVKDENGEPIGEMVEYEPAPGTVSVKLSFRSGQLSNEINAEAVENVKVSHLVADVTTDNAAINASEISVESMDANVSLGYTDSVSFNTDSFSVFAISYTVDFEYEVDGQVYQFSMEGGNSMALSQLIEILHVNTSDLPLDQFMKQVADVTFSDPALVEVVKTENDWLLNSLKAFDTQETLTVTMLDGQQFIVQVTDAAQSSDLTQFITNVTVNAPVGNDGKYEVRKGKPVTIDLKFKEKSNLQFDLNSMTYPIPAGLEAMEGAKGSLTITSEDGGTIYTIDGNEYEIVDGNLVLHWNTDHPDFEHLAASSNTEITLHISASLDGSESTIHFGSNIDKEFNITDPHGVTVEKSAWNINKQTGEVSYLVTVTSTGANKNIVVTDKISSTSNALTYKTGSVQVYNNKDDRRDATLVSGVTVNSQNNKGFTLTIPSMKDGQTYAVAYKGQLDLSKLTRNADGSYGVDSDTLNNVTAKPEGYGPDSSSNSLHTIYAKPSVNKSGGNPSDVVDGKRTIEWTLKATSVNTADGSSSLAGGTISDKISNEVIPGTDKTSQDLMKYAGAGIKIVITNDQNQVVDTREVSWQDLGVNPATATSWTYSVPSTGVDKTTQGTLTYTVTYKTEVDVSETISSIEVQNEGDSSKSDPSTGKKPVDPLENNQAGVDKKVVAVDQENNEVTWEVAITVPATGLTTAYLEDVYPKQWNATNAPHDTLKGGSISYTGLLNEENGVTETKTEDSSDPQKLVITFGYTDSNGTTHTGLYGTGEQRVVTVRFTTKNSTTWNNDPNSGNRNHVNTANLHANQKVFTDIATAVPTLTQKVTKKVHNNGLPVGTVMVNGAELPVWTYELVLEGVLPDSEIVDTFDSRLEFVPFETVDFGQSTSKPGVLYGGVTAYDMQSYVGNYINPGSYLDAYVDYSVNGNTVSFHIEEQNIPQFAYNDGTSNIENTYFKLIYQLRAKDEASLESLIAEAAREDDHTLKTIHNTAVFGPSSSSQDVKYVFNPVDKELINEGEIGGTNNVGKFRIVINPSGLDLNPDGDYLTMKDELVENLSIYYNTIQASPAEGVKWVASDDVFTFTIPDATPVTITYDALIIGTGSVHIRNEASIGNETSVVDTTKNVQAKAEGSSSNPSISILKHKEGDMTTKIQGAKFGLYWYNGDWKDENGYIKSDFTADNTKWEPVTDSNNNPVEFTTDENGVATFRGDANRLGWTLDEMNTLYALHEEEAPEGYQKKTTYYRFVMSDSGIPDYDHNIYFSGDTMRVGNNPEPGITIEKAVTGIELTEAQKQAITFEVKDPSRETTTLTFAQFVNGEYRITSDNFKAGIYTITEKTIPPEHYTLTTSISGVGTGSSVTTENGQTVASTSVTVNDLSKDYTVSFLNKYSSTSINVVKLGEKNEYLAGAEFQLVKINADTDAEEEVATKTSVATARGIQFSPLQDGEYILREVNPPEGYIALASDMRFSVVDGIVTWHGENKPSGSVSYKPSSNTVTVMNREDTIIEVHKVWAGEEGKTTPVTIKLYRTNLPIQMKTVEYRDNKTVFGQVTAPIGATIRAYYVTENGVSTQQDFTFNASTSQVHIGENNISDVRLEIILPADIENSKKLVETKETTDNTAIFNGLDRADPSGKTYSYWVEEETPTGRYIISYENNMVSHDSLSKVITVTNTPEEEQDGLIEVEKVWKDAQGATITDTSALPEIILQLRAKQDESPVTIHVVNEYNPSQEYCIASGNEVHIGDKVTVTLKHNNYVETFSVRAGKPNGDNIEAQNGSAGTSQSTTFTVSNTSIYIRVNSSEGLTASVNLAEAGGGETTSELPDPIFITLNKGNHYYWNSEEHPEVTLDTSKYAYYVVEETVPAGYEVSYSNNNEAGITKGKLTVTNTVTAPETGSVKVTKNFSGITEAEIPDSFKITATWGDEPNTNSKELKITGTQSENVTRTGEFPNYEWTISELPIGTEVTFTESGYNVDGYSVTVTGSATTNDKTTATAMVVTEPGEASFVNTYEKLPGSLKITKNVTVNDKSTSGKLADGDYTFTITGPGDATTVIHTVVIKVENGVATQYKMDAATTFTDLPNDKFVVVSELDEGDYTVTETLPTNGTALASITRGDQSNSPDATPSPVDLTNRKVTVHVTAGDTAAEQNTAQATFTNNIDVGSLKVRKEVTYNGEAPDTEAEKQALAGEYTFKIFTDSTCSTPYREDGQDKTLTITINSDGQPQDSEIVTLPIGTYWIQEQNPPKLGVTPNENPIEVRVTKETVEVPAVANFVNNREKNNNPDELTIDLEKTFTGLPNASSIPNDFKVVLTYNVTGSSTPVTVNLTGITSGHVTCTKRNNGMTWHWHVTHIPSSATNFAISEQNYDIAGYTRITKINGVTVENPGNSTSAQLLVPTITMTNVTRDYETSDSQKVFTVENDQILLVRMTNNVTMIVSKKSLSLAERTAIEKLLTDNDGKIPGNNAQAKWDLKFVYFSQEIQGNSFAYNGRIVYFDGNKVKIPHKSSNQEVRVDIEFKSTSAENSFTLENSYSETSISLDIEKVKKGETNVKLPGAVFTLRQIEDAAPVNGTYATKNGTSARDSAPTAETTGLTSFDKLTSGYYELTEKTPPVGYVLTDATTTYFKVENGEVKWLTKGTGKPSEWATKTAKGSGELITFQAAIAEDKEKSTPAKNAKFIIENEQGVALPLTGGIGTTLFTILGGLLIAGGGAALLIRGQRRRKRKEN